MRISGMVILLALIIALTISVFVLAKIGMDRVRDMPQPVALAPASDSLAAVEIALPQVESLSNNELIERPLFWEGRRPVIPQSDMEKSTVIEATGPDPFEKIKLVGVYSGGAIIIIDGVKQRILRSEDLAGWTLEGLGTASVTFVQGAKQKELQLEHAAVAAPQNAQGQKKNRINGRGKATDQTDPDDMFLGIAVESESKAIPAPTKQQNKNPASKPSVLPIPQLN